MPITLPDGLTALARALRSVPGPHVAEHVENVLSWCEAAGIKHVTVFVCSTENLQLRGDVEVSFLMR
ncbi:undecaprenyl diphosphate synthase family protein [Streptosporangium canum]|uniref:undecaprenyl diphosphate synthase family protein n=1 Tax=Streptosporangium canum TaxID=324952 RepID=UPI003436BABA